MNPKISIVVPIYNVERYLAVCVDSLRNQTLKDIEIILVDDGSPDKCGEIAEDYARKDKRIKVIHQKNAGLGPARNAGIRASSGEYVGFVDSDDWARPEMYENLYDTAVHTKADIVVSGHCDVSNGKIVFVKQHPLAGRTLNSTVDIMQMRKNLYGHGAKDECVDAFPMSVWIAIYRRNMLEENNLQFRNILSEDTIFNLNVYKHAKLISFTGDTDYCYRKDGQASITQTFSETKILKFQEFLTVLARMAGEESDEDCIIRAKRMAIDYCRLFVGIVDNAGIPWKEKVRIIGRFSENKEISRCWDGHPLKYLPVQQRIFHFLILHKQYGLALFLNWIRQEIKKGMQRINGST